MAKMMKNTKMKNKTPFTSFHLSSIVSVLSFTVHKQQFPVTFICVYRYCFGFSVGDRTGGVEIKCRDKKRKLKQKRERDREKKSRQK